MKTIYLTLLCSLITAASFSQTYYSYTAKKSGNWNDMEVWNIGVRSDGVHKTKVVIPAPFTVNVDNAVNSMGLGDIDITISGALALAPSTTIVLSTISTIQLVGSGAIIGSTSNQKITLGGISKYDGSLDNTKAGAWIADNTTGTSPLGFRSTLLLPVTFASFTASKEDGLVNLSWSTASETGNDHFDIERSYNGSNWLSIGSVKSKAINISYASYSFADATATADVVYYRLKQVDIDGAASYSVVKTVKNENSTDAKIYGAGKEIHIAFQSALKNDVVVTVMTTSGQVIERKRFSAGYAFSLELHQQTAGLTVVNVSDNAGINQTKKLFL